MTRWYLVTLVATYLGTAQAYPLYSIGTEVRGHAFTWQYSGLGSDNKPWSNAHATPVSVRAAISETFRAFNAGSPKDASGAACSTMQFTDGTPASGNASQRADQSDGKNTEGIFVSLSSDPIYSYMQGGTVAFAAPNGDQDGYVIDCDTVFNAVDMPFATDGDPGSIDIQGVAMQETAHCFGMHHVCQQFPGDGQPPCDGPNVDTQSVMFPFVGQGGKEPDARDQDNFCQIYPINGVGRPCETQDPNSGTGYAVADCAAGFSCACTLVGKICTRACAGDGDCPGGAVCGSGSCVPNFYPATAQIGVATRTSFTCDTNNLLHKAIGSPCAHDADCGTGEICNTTVAGGYCTVDCHSSQCPIESGCVSDVVTAADALCLKFCSLDRATCASSGCRAGLQCQPDSSGTNGTCWAPCKSDHDCDPGASPRQSCDRATGVCHRIELAPACGHAASDGGVSVDGGGAPSCAPSCAGVLCGDPDGCGGTCSDTSLCHVAGPPDAGPDVGTIRSPAPAPHKRGGCGSGQIAAAAALVFALRRRRRFPR